MPIQFVVVAEHGQIQFPMQFGESSVELKPRKAANMSVSQSVSHQRGGQTQILKFLKGKEINRRGSFYLRPKHPLVPIEKGWLASNTSPSFIPSHRSGSNFQGSRKFVADMLDANGLVATVI